MADINLPVNTIGTGEITTTPDVLTVVKFAERMSSVDVVIASTEAPVWWTCDGTNPDPANGVGWYIPRVGVDTRLPPTSGPTVVKLRSTGTAVLRVQRGAQ